VASKEPFFHFVKSGNYYYNRNAIYREKDRRAGTSKIGHGYFGQIEASSLTPEEKQHARSELEKAIRDVQAGLLYSLRMKIRDVHSMAFGGQNGGRNTQILKQGFSIIRVPGMTQQPDVITNPVESLRGAKHPAIFPVKLIEKLVVLTTPEGGLVLDPFMGSGSTAVACVHVGRHFVGIELSEEYIREAKKRLKCL
jgi:site-specific DNA-methyltransferase (adenine-specific)